MRRKFWIRLGLVLLGLLIVLYVGFWIALFNPLEGSVERLDALVPKNSVHWYVQGPWGEIRKTPLIEKHLFRSPLLDHIEAEFELEQYLYEPIRQLESQVNEQVPGFLGEFSVLEDLVGREVALTGQFSNQGNDLAQKVLNSKWLALTRISFKARFMEILKYEAVRKNIPGLKAYRDFYEYDVGPEAIREGAPESARYFYFQRIKDVLVLSNDRDLMEAAVHFGRAGGVSMESLAMHHYYFYELQWAKPPLASTLWLKPGDANTKLDGALSGHSEPSEGDALTFLRAFFPVRLTTTVMLKPGIEGEDRIPLRGTVRLHESIDRSLYDLHRTVSRPIAPSVNAWAEFLPSDRTFALLHLKMLPRDFLLTILSALDPTTRDLFLGNGTPGGAAGERWSVERLSGQLGDWFAEPVTIAWSRLPEVEEIDLDRFSGGKWEALPGTTIMLNVKENLDPASIVEFFTRNENEFNFGIPEERPSPLGRMFVLKTLPDAKLHLLKPAFAFVGHRFLFSTNVDELVRFLELKKAGSGSILESGNYREALDATFDEGNLFLFVDMNRAFRFLLDQRWQHAYDVTGFDPQRFRTDTLVRLSREHPRWTNDERQRAADEAFDDRERRRAEVDFPDAIREFRNNMILYEPFRWIAISDSPGSDLSGGVLLNLKGEIRLEKIGD